MTAAMPIIFFITQRLLRYGLPGLDAARYPFPLEYQDLTEKMTPLHGLYLLTDFLLAAAQPMAPPNNAPPADTLFDGVMALCDAAQPYKPVLQVLWDEIWLNPWVFLTFTPYARSALLTWARRHRVFAARTLSEELAFGGILSKAFLSWIHDDTPDQSATMVSLDRAIKQFL